MYIVVQDIIKSCMNQIKFVTEHTYKSHRIPKLFTLLIIMMFMKSEY